MLYLRSFGGLTISNGSSSLGGAAGQHRALALLALIASAGERGISRDRLVSYLWSESTAESARHALRQWLTLLRRDLHDADVIVGTSELRLNPKNIGCDIAEFDQAVTDRAHSRMAELYVGPFLDGFYLNEAPEFQRWVDEERARRRSQLMDAVEVLAIDCEEKDHRAKAAHWWQRLATLDPLSSRIAVHYMESLARAGDGTRALDFARLHEALVRADLETDPDPAVAKVAARLRKESIAISPPALPVSHQEPKQASALPLTAPPPMLASSSSKPKLAGGQRRTYASIFASLLVLTALGGAAERSFGRRAAPEQAPVGIMSAVMAQLHRGGGVADTSGVVVMPFRVSGADPGLGYLREGAMDLLAAKLSVKGGPRAVDPRTVMNAWRRTTGNDAEQSVPSSLSLARQLGAGALLLGAVVGQPSRLVITASLLTVPQGRLRAEASVEGSADSLALLVDHLAARLLAESAGEVALLSPMATPSLAALRSYLDGQAAYRRGQYQAAYEDFRAALKVDSSFALAALGVMRAGQWTWSNLEEYSETERRAWRMRDRLNRRDRALLLLRLGPRYPAVVTDADRLAGAEAAVAAAPDDAEAWYQLGDVLFHFGAILGLEDARGRAEAAFRRSLEIDSTYVPPVDHLIELAVFARDSARARRLFELTHDSLGDLTDYVRWRMAFVSDGATLSTVRRQIPSMSEASLLRIAGLGQLEGIAMRDVKRALDALQAHGGTRSGPEELMYLRHSFELNRGRPRAAVLSLDPRNRSLLRNGSAMLVVLDALFWEGDTTAAVLGLEQLDRTAATPSKEDSAASAYRYTAICGSALWRLFARADEPSAERAIHELRAGPPNAVALKRSNASALCAAALEATIAVNQRRPETARALHELDSLALTGIDGFAFPSAEGYVFGSSEANLLLARLRERSGDTVGALSALRRRAYHYGVELFLRGYSSTSFREEGRLAALLGQREEAIRAYRNYLALRDAPEPSRAKEVDRVRAGLAALEGKSRP